MTEATSVLLPGFTARSASLHGSRVAYQVAGEGPPVVLVHGLGGASSNWVETAPLLTGSHRVLAVDLPGHGASQPPGPDAELSLYAEAVAACAREEGLMRPLVVGHSFGGAVALELALQRPQLVGGIVLAASSGISSTSTRARVGLTILVTLRPSLLAARFRSVIARRRWLRRAAFAIAASDPAGLSPQAVEGLLGGSAAVSDGRSALSVLLGHDPRPRLGEILCPVLVLWGSRDRFVRLDDGHEYARLLRAPLRVLPDTGHLLIAERGPECADHIGAFARSLRPASDGVRQVDEHPVEAEPLRK